MSQEFEYGFESGVLWAATFLADRHDKPSIAAELCREAGITVRKLRLCDEADREGAAKVIKELLSNEWAEKRLRKTPKAESAEPRDGS